MGDGRIVPAQEGMEAAGINTEPGSQDDGWETPEQAKLGDSTRIQLYKDGQALEAAFNAIKVARYRVCLEVYIFRSDATGLAFAELLIRKARSGVAVYVIYDSLGSIDSDGEMFERMAKGGVRIAAFHPIKPWECRYSWRPANRDHRKLLIIDNDRAGLGGLNIGCEYAGSWIVPRALLETPWRDTAIGLRGPAVGSLISCFARTWRYVQYGGRIRDLALFHNVHEGEFGALASVPTRGSLFKPVWAMLREAKASILMTMSYFAPPDDLIEALCRAAGRGVRVRLMLPGVCDVPVLLAAARSFYEKLLGSGVEVYERQRAVLHAKTMCIDGETTIIGSTNLDYRSIEYNLELSVIIRSSVFGEQMRALFEHDVAHAKRITLGEWRRRPTRDRLMQWAVMRARYLL